MLTHEPFMDLAPVASAELLGMTPKERACESITRRIGVCDYANPSHSPKLSQCPNLQEPHSIASNFAWPAQAVSVA